MVELLSSMMGILQISLMELLMILFLRKSMKLLSTIVMNEFAPVVDLFFARLFMILQSASEIIYVKNGGNDRRV
jgi:hypothetical protein